MQKFPWNISFLPIFPWICFKIKGEEEIHPRYRCKMKLAVSGDGTQGFIILFCPLWICFKFSWWEVKRINTVPPPLTAMKAVGFLLCFSSLHPSDSFPSTSRNLNFLLSQASILPSTSCRLETKLIAEFSKTKDSPCYRSHPPWKAV